MWKDKRIATIISSKLPKDPTASWWHAIKLLIFWWQVSDLGRIFQLVRLKQYQPTHIRYLAFQGEKENIWCKVITLKPHSVTLPLVGAPDSWRNCSSQTLYYLIWSGWWQRMNTGCLYVSHHFYGKAIQRVNWYSSIAYHQRDFAYGTTSRFHYEKRMDLLVCAANCFNPSKSEDFCAFICHELLFLISQSFLFYFPRDWVQLSQSRNMTSDPHEKGSVFYPFFLLFHGQVFSWFQPTANIHTFTFLDTQSSIIQHRNK